MDKNGVFILEFFDYRVVSIYLSEKNGQIMFLVILIILLKQIVENKLQF